MKNIIHRASERGFADHSWLKAFHSFSFASYYDPQKVNFGALRVLNDDTVAPAMGFGRHPHQNMEIITIPTSGALRHRDSLGNEEVIQTGDVQVMSAGSGVEHSEMNANHDKHVSLFQIWILTEEQNVAPRYAQKTYDVAERENKWQLVVSPKDGGSEVWIHQQAWIHLGNFSEGKEFAYSMKNPKNGLYVMTIEGSVVVENQLLEKLDAIGIWETDTVNFKTETGCELLLIEVPMEF
jgi:redox-sensitive bicupin YhaK (pirin superfamily)